MYVINFDQYKLIKTHWIALYVNDNNVNNVALELKIFQKKIKKSQETKILQQIFIEHKHTIR